MRASGTGRRYRLEHAGDARGWHLAASTDQSAPRPQKPLAPPPRPILPAGLERRLLKALADGEPHAQQELRLATGAEGAMVGHALARLREEGQVERAGTRGSEKLWRRLPAPPGTWGLGRRVLQVLAPGRPMTQRAIGSETCAQGSELGDTLAELAQAGLIARAGSQGTEKLWVRTRS